MGAGASAQALERHFRSIRKTAPAAKPAPLPEPEPEPAPVLEPRTVLQPATVAQAHDSSALPTPFHHPAVLDYHQRLRQQVMLHVVHQQREALFLERLTLLGANHAVERGGGTPPAPGAAATLIPPSAEALADAMAGGGGGSGAAAGGGEAAAGAGAAETGGGGLAGGSGAQYAAQRAGVSGAVDTLLG